MIKTEPLTITFSPQQPIKKEFKTLKACHAEILRLREVVKTNLTEYENQLSKQADVLKELANKENLTQTKAARDYIADMNRRLLDILEAGSQNGTFPRRGDV